LERQADLITKIAIRFEFVIIPNREDRIESAYNALRPLDWARCSRNRFHGFVDGATLWQRSWRRLNVDFVLQSIGRSIEIQFLPAVKPEVKKSRAGACSSETCPAGRGRRRLCVRRIARGKAVMGSSASAAFPLSPADPALKIWGISFAVRRETACPFSCSQSI